MNWVKQLGDLAENLENLELAEKSSQQRIIVL